MAPKYLRPKNLAVSAGTTLSLEERRARRDGVPLPLGGGSPAVAAVAPLTRTSIAKASSSNKRGKGAFGGAATAVAECSSKTV